MQAKTALGRERTAKGPPEHSAAAQCAARSFGLFTWYVKPLESILFS